jgi:hypothetical protein
VSSGTKDDYSRRAARLRTKGFHEKPLVVFAEWVERRVAALRDNHQCEPLSVLSFSFSFTGKREEHAANVTTTFNDKKYYYCILKLGIRNNVSVL